MKTSKKAKILGLVIGAVMLMSIVPMVASAATLTLDNPTTPTAVNGVYTFVVTYHASTEVEQVTLLATRGATAPTETTVIAETDIVAIDQLAKPTGTDIMTGTFTFSVDADKFDSTYPNMYVKIGGTALTSATSATEPNVLFNDVVTTFKVFGYVDVPVTVGSTVTLKDGTTTTTDATGRFEFTGVANGDYNLTISAKSALTRTIPVTVASADNEVSLVGNKITLMFGDTDGNGKVEFADLMAVKTAYNQVTTDVGFNANIDLDSNGKVEFADLMAVKTNYNKIPSSYGLWTK